MLQTLRLSHQARSEKNVGEIVNLMSVDVTNFSNIAYVMMVGWAAPLQIIICIILLFNVLGGAILVCFGAILFIIVPGFCIIPMVQKTQREQMKYKDERLKLMSELLNGIKVLKLYAWELSFEKMVIPCLLM